ncbi:MAG: polyhydroxyalkanoic acid system family protein [Candidatus Binatia bacterium]
MPKLNMTVAHRLSQAEAVKRIRGLLENVKTEFADKVSDVHEEWNGNTGTFSFSALGFPVSGVLTVTPSEVEISGDLPFLAAVYKKKIESTIREQAESLLA